MGPALMRPALMRPALSAEVRKLFSTRMWWIIALVMVAYLAFIALVFAASLAFATTSDGPDGAPLVPGGASAAATVYSLTNPIGYVFPLLMGSMLFTAEFRHKTITGSLLVEPRRSVLLAAKLVAGLVLGLVYGVVAVATVVLAAAPVLAIWGDGAFLTSSQTISVLGWTVVVFAAWSAIGVAFGGFVTNQVAAIVVIVGFTQFVEPIARAVGSLVDALSSVSQFLPGAAADAVLGASALTSFAGGGGGELLPRWAGLLVLLAYVAIFAALARWVTLRRDIA